MFRLVTSQADAVACYRRSHLGRYHADRHLGAALQNTAKCPDGVPGVRAASARPQSHITHSTVITPGPHSCP